MSFAERLSERKYTHAETMFILALALSEWVLSDARVCFEELGGHPAAFNRLHARLLADRVIKSHPRRPSTHVQLDLACEGLRVYYERVVAHREVKDAANS